MGPPGPAMRAHLWQCLPPPRVHSDLTSNALSCPACSTFQGSDGIPSPPGCRPEPLHLNRGGLGPGSSTWLGLLGAFTPQNNGTDLGGRAGHQLVKASRGF